MPNPSPMEQELLKRQQQPQGKAATPLDPNAGPYTGPPQSYGNDMWLNGQPSGQPPLNTTQPFTGGTPQPMTAPDPNAGGAPIDPYNPGPIKPINAPAPEAIPGVTPPTNVGMNATGSNSTVFTTGADASNKFGNQTYAGFDPQNHQGANLNDPMNAKYALQQYLATNGGLQGGPQGNAQQVVDALNKQYGGAYGNPNFFTAKDAETIMMPDGQYVHFAPNGYGMKAGTFDPSASSEVFWGATGDGSTGGGAAAGGSGQPGDPNAPPTKDAQGNYKDSQGRPITQSNPGVFTNGAGQYWNAQGQAITPDGAPIAATGPTPGATNTGDMRSKPIGPTQQLPVPLDPNGGMRAPISPSDPKLAGSITSKPDLRPGDTGVPADTAGVGGTPESRALFDQLMQRARQSENINPNDPIIKAQEDAYTAKATQAMRSGLSSAAESAGPDANMGAATRSANEQIAQGAGAMQAQLMQNELVAKRKEIQDAISGATGMITGEQQMQLTDELHRLDAQINQGQFTQSQGQQESQFGRSLGQRESEFARSMGLNWAQLSQQDQQFIKQLMERAYEFDSNDQFRNSPLGSA